MKHSVLQQRLANCLLLEKAQKLVTECFTGNSNRHRTSFPFDQRESLPERHSISRARRQIFLRIAPGTTRSRGASRGTSEQIKMAAGPVSRILSAVAGRTIIPLGHALLRGSSDLPGGCGAPSRHAFRRRCKFLPWTARQSRTCSGGENPSLFGLAPCGVCHARCITAAAVRSYRTFSPLPRRRSKPVSDDGFTTTTGRYIFCGTFRRTVPPILARGPSRTLSGTLLCGVRTFLCLATATVRSGSQRFNYSALHCDYRRNRPASQDQADQAFASGRGASANAYTSSATPISKGIRPIRYAGSSCSTP